MSSLYICSHFSLLVAFWWKLLRTLWSASDVVKRMQILFVAYENLFIFSIFFLSVLYVLFLTFVLLHLIPKFCVCLKSLIDKWKERVGTWKISNVVWFRITSLTRVTALDLKSHCHCSELYTSPNTIAGYISNSTGKAWMCRNALSVVVSLEWFATKNISTIFSNKITNFFLSNYFLTLLALLINFHQWF